MNQRIPLPLQVEARIINGYGVGTVSARELHSFLEIEEDFPSWIKNRISEYDFIENQDYITLHFKMPQMVREIDGTARSEYFITLNMTKQLAMLENNEKGKQVRQYFIECEKKLNPTTTTSPQGPVVCLAWTNTFRGVLSYNS